MLNTNIDEYELPSDERDMGELLEKHRINLYNPEKRMEDYASESFELGLEVPGNGLLSEQLTVKSSETKDEAMARSFV